MTPALYQMFEHAGVTYYYGPGAIGPDGPGPAAAAGALRMIKQEGLEDQHMLDLCCGIGVIGLTIATQADISEVHCVTLSDINIFNIEAVRSTARWNQLLRVTLIDVQTAVSDGLSGLLDTGPFDLIVSNPPHNPKPWLGPVTASSIGGYDASWGFHRRLFQYAHRFLSSEGRMWLLENGKFRDELFTLAISITSRLNTPTLVETVDCDEDSNYFWLKYKVLP